MKYGMWAIALLACVQFSCGESTEYNVVMTPHGKSVMREVTKTVTSHPYSSSEKPQVTSSTSKSTFRSTIPSDIGNAGEYQFYETMMGSTGMYLERYPGCDRVGEMMEQYLRNSDKIAELLVGWFKHEMPEGDFKKASPFLEKEFPADLKNAITYLALMQLEPADQDDCDAFYRTIVVRVLQYAVERKYILPEQVPELVRLANDWNNPDEGRHIMKSIQLMIARKARLSDGKTVPKSLEFLTDPQNAYESLSAYAVTTKGYQDYLDQWQKDQQEHAQAAASQGEPPTSQPSPPTAKDYIQTLACLYSPSVFKLNGISEVGGGYYNIKLRLSQLPHSTNGHWAKDTSIVEWKISSRGFAMPSICYAVWSTPNEAFQKEHFGKVVLEGEGLTEYCIWRKGLTLKEGRQWDALLFSLKPGPDLLRRLKDFRFQDEPLTQPASGPAGEAQPRSYARQAIDPILRKLESSTTCPSQPESQGAE